jgi:hypothetical protein
MLSAPLEGRGYSFWLRRRGHHDAGGRRDYRIDGRASGPGRPISSAFLVVLELASCAVWLGLLLLVGTQFRVLLIEQLPANLSGHFFLLSR